MTDVRARTFLFLVASVCVASPALAQKTDVVHLENGDDLTGEIKGLDRGRLKYSTRPCAHNKRITWNSTCLFRYVTP